MIALGKEGVATDGYSRAVQCIAYSMMQFVSIKMIMIYIRPIPVGGEPLCQPNLARPCSPVHVTLCKTDPLLAQLAWQVSENPIITPQALRDH